jgi:hypothetical protein
MLLRNAGKCLPESTGSLSVLFGCVAHGDYYEGFWFLIQWLMKFHPDTEPKAEPKRRAVEHSCFAGS